MSFIIILIVFAFSNYNGPDCSVAPFKMWTLVQGGYYIINFMFVILYYKHLQRANRESLGFLIVNCILNFVHTCWLIYGNVIFWSHANYIKCGEEME